MHTFYTHSSPAAAGWGVKVHLLILKKLYRHCMFIKCVDDHHLPSLSNSKSSRLKKRRQRDRKG